MMSISNPDSTQRSVMHFSLLTISTLSTRLLQERKGPTGYKHFVGRIKWIIQENCCDRAQVARHVCLQQSEDDDERADKKGHRNHIDQVVKEADQGSGALMIIVVNFETRSDLRPRQPLLGTMTLVHPLLEMFETPLLLQQETMTGVGPLFPPRATPTQPSTPKEES
jgi:hypothetical protein